MVVLKLLSFYGLSRLIVMGGQLLLVPIAISQLGVSGFGVFSILLQGALLLRLVTIQPVAQVYIREYSQLSKSFSDKELYNAALHYATPILALLLMLLFTLRSLVTHVFAISDNQLILMGGMAVVLSIFGLKQVLLYCRDIKRYTLIDLMQSIGVLIGLVIAGIAFPSVESYEIAYLLVTLLMIFALTRIRQAGLSIANLRISELWTLVLGYGTPLMIGEALSWIVGVADRFQIAALISVEQAGVYTAAYQLFAAPMTMLGFVAAMVIQPTVFSSNKDVFKSKMEKVSSLLVIASICFVLLSYVYGVEVYSLFVRRHAEVEPSLVILLVCAGIANSFFQLELISSKYARKGMSILGMQLMAATLLLIGNWILLPLIGIVGAAITSVCAYVVMIVSLRMPKSDLRHSYFSMRAICTLMHMKDRC